MSSFAADLRCPDDGHLLRIHNEAAVSFAACRHCHGLWFGPDALLPASPRADIPRASQRWTKQSAKAKRDCPQCRLTLRTERIDRLEIERCPTCFGVWLDAGEYDVARSLIRDSVRQSDRDVFDIILESIKAIGD